MNPYTLENYKTTSVEDIASNLKIDRSSRRCGCGHEGLCAHDSNICMQIFTMLDYPVWYLPHKGLYRKGSRVGTCPPCELSIGRCRMAAAEVEAFEEWVKKLRAPLKE